MLVVTLALMVLPLPVWIVVMVTISYKHAVNQIPEDAPVCDNGIYISFIAVHSHTLVISSSVVFVIFHISSDDHWYCHQLVEHSAIFVSLAPPVTSVWMVTHGLELSASVSHLYLLLLLLLLLLTSNNSTILTPLVFSSMHFSL